MKEQHNFSHQATILPVVDMKRSVNFYTNSLQFELAFSWGEPLSYVILKQGGVSIHLTRGNGVYKPSGDHCSLYIFVYDIDKIYNHCVKNNVNIINPLGLRDYNMKDFDIKDPDGHIISFGMGA